MKRVAAILSLLPGAALAHGGHVELTGVAHDGFHFGPVAALALIAAALVLARMRGRS